MGSGRTDFVHARSPLCTLEAGPTMGDFASAAHSRAAPAQQLPRAAPRPTPQPAPRGMAAAISAAPPAASTRQKTARPWQAARPRCRHSRCSRSFLVINAQPRTALAFPGSSTQSPVSLFPPRRSDRIISASPGSFGVPLMNPRDFRCLFRIRSLPIIQAKALLDARSSLPFSILYIESRSCVR